MGGVRLLQQVELARPAFPSQALGLAMAAAETVNMWKLFTTVASLVLASWLG